jgi:hypothetical protein
MKSKFSIAVSSRINVAIVLLLCSEFDCLQAKRGRIKEFESALQFLRGENADISQEAADIIKLNEGATNIELLLLNHRLFRKLNYYYYYEIGFPCLAGIYRKRSIDI